MNATNKQGKLVILSGPSGVGKSTICRQVVQRLKATLSVSATTRPRGAAEIDGKDYFFLSSQEFMRRLEQNEFLEYAEVFGNAYGTPRTPVEKAMAEGRVVILEIDVQGAMQVKTKMSEAVLIFILPPRPEELLKRLEARARGEDEQTLKKRLDKAEAEIAVARHQYDYFIVNEVLDKAVQDVITIIQGHENP